MDYEKQLADYLKLTDDKSEKELLQLIAFYNRRKLAEIERIRENVRFFFWLTVIGLIISFFVFFNI